MSRHGYIVLLTVLLGLMTFVFWPGDGYRQQIAFYDGPAQTRFSLSGYGYRQEIAGDQVVIIAGDVRLDRQAKSSTIADFWRYWRRLRVDARSVRTLENEAALASYGIGDDAPRLQADGIDLRWHLDEERAFVYDARSGEIAKAGAHWLGRIDALARRFDEQGIFSGDRSIRGLTIDDQTYALTDEGWQDSDRPARPVIGPRIVDLLSALAKLNLNDPAGVALPTTEPLMRGQLRYEDDRLQAWAVHGSANDLVVAVDGLPPQPLPADAWADLQACRAELAVDRLFAFRDTLLGNPIIAATVYTGALEWFTVVRTQEDDAWDGESTWDLSWSSGRVRAASGTAYMLAEALNAIVVEDCQVKPFIGAWTPPLDPSVTSLVIETGDEPQVLMIAGDRLNTLTHQAQAVRLPPLLSDLRPERFIDPMIHNIEQTRLIKLQRQAGERGEVYVLDADRGWQRTYPSPGPVVTGAMEQLLSAIAHLRAEDARLQTDADRAILDQPERELDARIAARQQQEGDDQLRIEHTLDRDWGLALAREGDDWRAVDKESGISYRLSADRVRELFRPLNRPVLLPLVASQIVQVVITGEDGRHYTLRRDGERWIVQQGPIPSDADDLQVRRYLQKLMEAAYVEQREDPKPIPATARLGTVEVGVAGSYGDLINWTLVIGRGPGELDLATVSSGTGDDATSVQGGYSVSPELFPALTPPAQSFLRLGAE